MTNVEEQKTNISQGGCKSNDSPLISREDVRFCYQHFLGREPESETAIEGHLTHKSIPELIQAFTECEEYKNNQHTTEEKGMPIPNKPFYAIWPYDDQRALSHFNWVIPMDMSRQTDLIKQAIMNNDDRCMKMYNFRWTKHCK